MNAVPESTPIDAEGAPPVLRPPARGWWAPREGELPAIARRFRQQLLGIDDDARVIMSGHQASWWHPGILAKWFALGALTSPGTHAAWVVVDQDDNDPTSVAYPRVGPARGEWRMLRPAGEGPLATRGVITTILPPPMDAVTTGVGAGLAAMQGAMSVAGVGAGSLAEQVHRAVLALAAPLESTPVRSFFATGIARTDLFAQFLAAIAANPAACIGAYNQAVRKVPHAGVRELTLGTSSTPPRVELPLWSIVPGAGRMPVFAHELSRRDPTTLAPRALLMTALLRLGGCDLFLHGLGGGAYDAITDEWLRLWLPSTTSELARLRLAPTGVVSATRYIAMPTPTPIASPEESARAAWQAHHARHSPEMLARDDLAKQKRELLARVAALPRRSPARSEAYRAMHELLARARATQARELEAWRQAAQRAEASRQLAAVVFDRTWAFPMHDAGAMRALRDQVRRGVANDARA